jgi:hypothetical protein
VNTVFIVFYVTDGKFEEGSEFAVAPGVYSKK